MSINATEKFEEKNGTKIDVIKSVNYVISDDSANGMFNSCRNVQVLRAGVIDIILFESFVEHSILIVFTSFQH